MSRVSPRPLRADAARNRQSLLDAARAAFEQHGVAASLDDVARAAGVGAGTLYRHFPTRDHLVLAVIDEGLESIHRFGMSLLDQTDPIEALLRWLNAFVEQGSTFQGLARTLVAPPPEDEGGTCRLARRSGHALMQRAVAAGLLREDVEFSDVLDMAAAIAWVGEQAPAGQPDRADRDASQRERLLRIVVDGISR